ncbi:MAG: hypothetical protein PHF18_09465 [Methanosarcina sp.]|nr:hypothetical protein [Methanosarcina sp.]
MEIIRIRKKLSISDMVFVPRHTVEIWHQVSSPSNFSFLSTVRRRAQAGRSAWKEGMRLYLQAFQNKYQPIEKGVPK